MKEKTIDGETYYEINPAMYRPNQELVARDAFYSHQWPWLIKDSFYTNEGGIERISSVNALKKAVTSKVAIECRENPGSLLWKTCDLLTGQVESFTAPNEEKLKKKLIIVDKSTRRLMVYDLESRALEQEFEVAIGKGTEARPAEKDRRVVRDYKTPV